MFLKSNDKETTAKITAAKIKKGLYLSKSKETTTGTEGNFIAENLDVKLPIESPNLLIRLASVSNFEKNPICFFIKKKIEAEKIRLQSN